jgi:hypothetical protein
VVSSPPPSEPSRQALAVGVRAVRRGPPPAPRPGLRVASGRRPPDGRVGPDGSIAAQSGGFKLLDCYATDDNCYIDAGEDVRDNGISSEIATANSPDAAATASSSSPRDSDGSAPGAGDRYPFYALVTG